MATPAWTGPGESVPPLLQQSNSHLQGAGEDLQSVEKARLRKSLDILVNST
jgi:hypothetical protein